MCVANQINPVALRERVISATVEQDVSSAGAAEVFKVSVSTVKRIVAQFRADGVGGSTVAVCDVT